MKTLSSLVAVAAVSLLFGGAVSAAEFKVNYTMNARAAPEFMPIGDDNKAAVNVLDMAATNDNASDPVLNNMKGVCRVLLGVGKDGRPFSLDGYCTYESADGKDAIFEECHFRGNDRPCTLNAGTGKFEGIKGKLQVTPKPDGGIKIGEYTLPKH